MTNDPSEVWQTCQTAAAAVLDPLIKHEAPINYANIIPHSYPDELRAASGALMDAHLADSAQHPGAPIVSAMLVALADRAARYLYLGDEAWSEINPQCAALTRAGRRCANPADWRDPTQPFCATHCRLRGGMTE